MIFQPIFNPLVLALVTVLGLGFTVTMSFLVRKASKSLQWAWIGRAFILLFACLLMFRPGIGEYKNIEVYANQFDVYFVVDTTASMVAEDWEIDTEATRMEAVKNDISRLVDAYPSARYGLITFNSEPAVQTPLTRDSTALMNSVKNLQPEITKNSQGSSVRAASDLLEETMTSNAKTSPDRARLVFFFSDGENTSVRSNDDENSFVAAGSQVTGGTVYGYGTPEGGRMKTQHGYFITSDEGEYIMDTSQTPETEAISKIDEDVLKTIAQELTVEYSHRVSSSPIEIPEIDSEMLIDTNMGMNVTTDYTWVIALSLLVLLSAELSLVLIQMKRISKKGGDNG